MTSGRAPSSATSTWWRRGLPRRTGSSRRGTGRATSGRRARWRCRSSRRCAGGRRRDRRSGSAAGRPACPANAASGARQRHDNMPSARRCGIGVESPSHAPIIHRHSPARRRHSRACAPRLTRRRRRLSVPGPEPLRRSAHHRSHLADDARGEDRLHGHPRPRSRGSASSARRTSRATTASPRAGRATGASATLRRRRSSRRRTGWARRGIPALIRASRRAGGPRSALSLPERGLQPFRPHRPRAERRPRARPALGPHRGSVRRRPVPRRRAGHGVHARAAGRRSPLLEDGGAAQALPREQQRGRRATSRRRTSTTACGASTTRGRSSGPCATAARGR